jgi:predicted dehydrogenase
VDADTPDRCSPNGPVRFGILGTGPAARSFATALQNVEGATLEAVASRTPQTADTYWAQLPQTRIVAGERALLEDERIDVVYIATPHHLHASQAIASLEAGKAVLCEKPFTLDATEAQEVVGLARRQRLFCMEAMWMRFIPALRHAVALVREGAIGQPRMLHADFGVPMAETSSNRLFDRGSGGGALLDRGVYAISLAIMLFGRVTGLAACASTTGSQVDEHVGFTLRFEQGELAVLSSSLTSLTGNGALITGTRGSVSIEAPFVCPERLRVRRYQPAGITGNSPGRRTTVLEHARRHRAGQLALAAISPLIARARVRRIHLPIAGNGYGYEAAEVVRCVRAGELESPWMTLDDTIVTMETLDAVRRAAGLDG